MKYIDLHCDALTKIEGVFQVTGEKLKESGCLLQCFAAFVEGKTDRFRRALALAERFETMCDAEGLTPVRSYADLASSAPCAMLTVENGGAVEGSLEKLALLYTRGVRLMTLVWNDPNEIGFPAFPDYEAVRRKRADKATRERVRGLTDFGHTCVAAMEKMGMIVDVSHASDALVEEVARIASKPFVASHSGANAVYPCARNLTDEGIRAVAGSGGVIGLDFCADFLSDDLSYEGQRAALLSHAVHIVRTGGEDVLALGSDFDGIPENAYLRSASDMPRFLDDLVGLFGARIAEKIACGNALRVMKICLGEGKGCSL